MKFSVTFAVLMGVAAVNAAVLPQDSLMKRTPGPLTNIVGRTYCERNIADKDKEEKREANIKDNGGEGKEKREANIKDNGGEGKEKREANIKDNGGEGKEKREANIKDNGGEGKEKREANMGCGSMTGD